MKESQRGQSILLSVPAVAGTPNVEMFAILVGQEFQVSFIQILERILQKGKDIHIWKGQL